MRHITWAGVATALVFAFALSAAPRADAIVLACDVATATECQINSLHVISIPAGGAYTLKVELPLLRLCGVADPFCGGAGPGELRVPVPDNGVTRTFTVHTPALVIGAGGRITGDAPAGDRRGVLMDIQAGTGDIVLAGNGQTGATITANQSGPCNGGIAGSITLQANAFQARVITEPGSVISANGSSCPGGAIKIAAPEQGAVDISGDVLSASTMGATGRAGGGPIFVAASCDLTVRDTGRVMSTGIEPGADLVHLEGGCAVVIEGQVASTGAGRIVPNNPPNSCGNVAPAPKAARRNPTVRPDKPATSTACVEVWAGDSLTIRRDVAGLNGEINADSGLGGTTNLGTGWVDLFARGDISILSAAAPAVHANGLSTNAGTGEQGGLIAVKSRDGKVVAKGLALQANAGTTGADGGAIAVEGKLDVDLGAAALEARGAVAGATSSGGRISARSFTAAILSDASSTLDASAGAANGVVQLTACGATGFPPGVVLQVPPVETSGVCGGQPGFQSYVILPACPCANGTPRSFCTQAEVRSVLNPVSGLFPGNKGPDVVVDARVASIQAALDGANDANDDGYIIVAVIANDDGLLGGHVNQTVEIKQAYPKRFALLGCSATLHASGTGLPAGHITAAASSPPGSPENIFVMNLYGADSSVAGWLIEGDGRVLRATRGIGNAVGIKFVGNNNIMKIVRSASNTGTGVVVIGNGNTLSDIDAWASGGDGVFVSGDGNLLDGIDAGDRGKGNGGNGITIVGAGNTIDGSDAFANAGHGMLVSGNGNRIIKSNGGERSKGNGLDGFHVEGNGNLLSENDAFANQRAGLLVKGDNNSIKQSRTGDAGQGNGGAGLDVVGNANALDGNRANGNTGAGIRITGTANTLKNNRSNDGGLGGGKTNLGGQYCMSDGSTLDLGGNKKDNVNFVGAGTPKKYPEGCVN